jgi:hypothetical protein
MAHPFFDALAWPSARKEAQDLLKALAKVYKTSARISDLYSRVPDDLPALNLNQPPRDIWIEALSNLAIHGSVARFCEILGNEVPGNVPFHAAVDAVVTAKSDVERRILSGGVYCVDRAPLRDKLSLLLARDSPVAVLVVRGGTQTGKTHSRFLFEAAAREAGARPVYLGLGLVAKDTDVVRELFTALAATNDIPDVVTTKPAWYDLVCSKLLEVAIAKDVRLWVAVDDLGPGPDDVPLLDPDILVFCNQFALKLQAPQYQERFRLMLIHHPDTTPTRWPTMFWRLDTVGSDDITDAEVAEFIRSWSMETGKVIAEEKVTTLATEVLAEVDAQPPAGGAAPVSRLQRMYDLLDATTRSLEQP